MSVEMFRSAAATVAPTVPRGSALLGMALGPSRSSAAASATTRALGSSSDAGETRSAPRHPASAPGRRRRRRADPSWTPGLPGRPERPRGTAGRSSRAGATTPWTLGSGSVTACRLLADLRDGPGQQLADPGFFPLWFKNQTEHIAPWLVGYWCACRCPDGRLASRLLHRRW